MVAYFCHQLSDNYVDLADLYVDLSVIYVSKYVKVARQTIFLPVGLRTCNCHFREVDRELWVVAISDLVYFLLHEFYK